MFTETVTTLTRQSENKTVTLFNQVYRAMASQSAPTISALYQAMVDYVSPANAAESLQQQPLSQDMLHERFADFFKRLFPIAYHRAINPSQPQHDFSARFKSCLHERMGEIEPFGDIPKQIGGSLVKSLEATRVLIQALALGRSVLEKTDGLIFSGSSEQQEACYKALLRMTHCPKCKGIPRAVMPCRGFCTNVMKGCMMEPALELDLVWSQYIETVERLVVAVERGPNDDPLGLNVEKAVRHLDSRISDAVMHAMEKGPSLEEKVRQICGRPEFESTSTLSINWPTSTSSSSSPRSNGQLLGILVSRQLHAQLGNFLASVYRSRTFYGTLADTICEDYPERSCWNGERVGEYAKTVVDSSLISQKYNPEFAFMTSASSNKGYSNDNASVLIDQLRHVNQVVQSQLSMAPDPSVLLADEGLEGSGSGDSPMWSRKPGHEPDDTEDEEDDVGDDDDEASGSGLGPTRNDRISPDDDSDLPETGGGAAGISVSLPIILLTLSLGVV
ncbi:hypothetical protein TKK_0002015 [Trichogramma kaykai]|uniref:Glypican-5 n=1 Tax=Trichogramma kaykai TaxID=54128 RepID=A0ABD2X924_9HYME